MESTRQKIKRLSGFETDDIYEAFCSLLRAKPQDSQRVLQFLDEFKELDINRKFQGVLLIEVAMEENHKEILLLLIARGANINMKYNGTVLGTAVSLRQKETVSLLLDLGADINAVGGFYGTALSAAAASGQKDMILLLLDRGADINAMGSGDYATALCAAIFNRRNEIVLLLLDRGADVNIVGNHSGSALTVAAVSGQKDMIMLLLDRGADINAVGGGPNGTVMRAAVSSKKKDIILLLLDLGADVNAVGDDCGPALGRAASLGQQDMISLLLGRGADVNVVGGGPGTALIEAASSGLIYTVSHLLDLGADINAVGGFYGTALAATVHKDILLLLLDRGADVNVVGGHFGTALGSAAYGGHKDIVSLLLDRGADVNAVGGHYGTALCAAAYSGKKDILSLLLDRGANINVVKDYYGTALGAAAYNGQKEAISLLLDRGADVNAVGGHYGNALSIAAHRGHKDVVSLLLDEGADVKAVGGHHGTALGAAASSGQRDVVSLLLDRGADLNAVGGHYGTVLAAATKASTVYNVHSIFEPDATVSLLLDRLAALALTANAVTGKYGSALGIAAYLGHTDMVSLLLKHGADATCVGGSYRPRLAGVYPDSLDAAMAKGSKASHKLSEMLASAIKTQTPTTAAGQRTDSTTVVATHDRPPPFPMPYNAFNPGPYAPSISCPRGKPNAASASTILSSISHGADLDHMVNITPEQANMLCRDATEEDLILSLVTLVGLHADTAKGLHEWIQNDVRSFIARNFDFGLAYAAARVAWGHFNDDSVDDDSISAQRWRWHWHAKQLDNARSESIYIDVESEQELLNSPYSIMPRRMWDLKSNRVVEFRMLHAAYLSMQTSLAPDVSAGAPPYWVISHSWTDNLTCAKTSINQYQWPVPLPTGLGLDSQLRQELLSFGAEYIWLDVLCLRQQTDAHPGLTRVKQEEWKLDVPTIGNIYRCADRIVRYFNGLGLTFSKDGWDGARHWLQRAWTLQEIRMEHTTINGGILVSQVGRVFMNTRGKVSGKEITLREAIRPVLRLAEVADSPRGCDVYDLAREMDKRYSSNPVDKLSGLFYLLRTTELPCYDAEMECEDFWTASFHLLPIHRKLEILLDFPYRGSDQQWFPTWKQMMSWPERDPDYEYVPIAELELTVEESLSVASRHSLPVLNTSNELGENKRKGEKSLCVHNVWSVSSVAIHPTSDSKEYEALIENKPFGFYSPYKCQERINTNLANEFTLIIPVLRNACNWIVCKAAGEQNDEQIGKHYDRVAEIKVLKKVGVLRTDSLSELLVGGPNGGSMLEQIDCLVV